MTPTGGSHGKPHWTTKILSLASRRHSSGVAARGASAAAGAGATDRCTDGLAGEQFGIPVTTRIVCAGAAKIGLGGGPQFADRHSLVDSRRPGVDASIREGTRRATARPHSFANHTHHCGAIAGNAHHPHRFRDSCRSVGSGFVASLARPGGNATGFVVMEGSL